MNKITEEERKGCHKAYEILMDIAVRLYGEDVRTSRKYLFSSVRAIIPYILNKCEEYPATLVAQVCGINRTSVYQRVARVNKYLDNPLPYVIEYKIYNEIMDEYYGE